MVQLQAQHSGKCLDIPVNDRRIIQSTYNNNLSQRWNLEWTPKGMLFKNGQNNQCLDVEYASGADGARIIYSSCHGGDNQLWRPIVVENKYELQSVHSGKCLDVIQADLAEEAKVMQYQCHGGNNQLWKWLPVLPLFQKAGLLFPMKLFRKQLYSRTRIFLSK